MRNKKEFLDDYNSIVKEEMKNDQMAVEDAAHSMNQEESTVFTVPSDYTVTGKDEHFIFEKKERPKTDNHFETVEDYFYIGRGGK